MSEELATIRVDDGSPLRLLDSPEGVDGDGFVVDSAACINPSCTCTRMTLAVRLIRRIGDDHAQTEGLPLTGDVSSDGTDLRLDTARHGPFTDTAVAWIRSRLEAPESQAWIAERWRRMRGQIGDPAYPAATALNRTDILIPFIDVFPWDFNLTVVHDHGKYLALDHYCLRPGCRCDNVLVHFVSLTDPSPALGDVGTARASLSRVRKPTIAGQPVVVHLWNALLARITVAGLRDRFSRMRRFATHVSESGGPTPSRGALCPCGSGKKYKRCCGR